MEKENNKRKIGILISAIIIVILLLIGFTYTYLSSHNKTDRTVQAGTLLIEYSDEGMETVNLSNIQPIYDKDMMEKASKIPFKVINKGTSLAYVEIDLTDITISDALKSADFKWTLYSGDEKISEGNFVNAGEKVPITKNQEITSSKNYELYIWISETGLDQSYMMEKTFSAKITINGHQNPVLLSEAIKDNNSPIDTKEPDFNKIAKTDEGLIEGEDTDGKTYYFRGAVEDNYVKIDGLKWHETELNIQQPGEDMLFRIVRINGDGTIRIISDGPVANGQIYNGDGKPEYVGYTYNNGKKCTSDNVCDGTEGISSDIKKALDKWYNKYMIKYDSLIAVSKYCNDTTTTTATNNDIYYGAYNRLNRNDGHVPEPTFICPNTDKDYGGEYKLKVGLLSADEAAFAGVDRKTTSESYILKIVHSDKYYYIYWTGSPSLFDYFDQEIMAFYNNLGNPRDISDDGEAVAVINLKADILYESGSGTKNNPYVVKVK